MSEDLILKDRVRKLADALPSIIKALEDLYILIAETLVEEDEATEYEKRILQEREKEEELPIEEAIKILEQEN